METILAKNKLLTEQNDLLKSLLDNCMEMRGIECGKANFSANGKFSKSNGRPFKRVTDANNPAGSVRNVLDNAIDAMIKGDLSKMANISG